MIRIILAGLAFVFASVSAAANLPIASSKLRDTDDLVARATTGNGLNVSAEQYLAHVQNLYPEAGIKNREGLTVFIKNLSLEACPSGERTLSSYDSNARKFRTIQREFRAGEKCFVDRNTGRVFASADCGNLDVTQVRQAVAPVQQTAPVAQPAAPAGKVLLPAPAPVASTTVVVEQRAPVYQQPSCPPGTVALVTGQCASSQQTQVGGYAQAGYSSNTNVSAPAWQLLNGLNLSRQITYSNNNGNSWNNGNSPTTTTVFSPTVTTVTQQPGIGTGNGTVIVPGVGIGTGRPVCTVFGC